MKIGIVGAGMIVPDFLKAMEKLKEKGENIEFVAISATQNGIERMKKYSKEYGIKNIYTNYDEMLEDDIDTVYVAIPNNLHFEFAKKALNKNKHVILEKPFTTTLKETKELIKIAEEKKVLLFEAISNQYFPNYLKTKELVSEIGEIKIVQLNFSQYSSRYDRFKKGDIAPAFDPRKSGGALMDLNVYNIHFVVGLFGKPKDVKYIANIEKDIDTSGVLILDYGTFKCVAIGAKDCNAPLLMNIQGDKGYINSQSPANIYSEFIFVKNDGKQECYKLNEVEERLYYELQEFMRLYKEKDFAKMKEYNDNTKIVMEILEKARKYAGLY